jgi:hypothetical protein
MELTSAGVSKLPVVSKLAHSIHCLSIFSHSMWDIVLSYMLNTVLSSGPSKAHGRG